MESRRWKDDWASVSWSNIVFWGLLMALPLVHLSGSGSVSSFSALYLLADHPYPWNTPIVPLPASPPCKQRYWGLPPGVWGLQVVAGQQCWFSWRLLWGYSRQCLFLDHSWIFLYPQPIVSLECKTRRKFLLPNYLVTYDSSAFLYKNRHFFIIEVMAPHMHTIFFAALQNKKFRNMLNAHQHGK